MWRAVSSNWVSKVGEPWRLLSRQNRWGERCVGNIQTACHVAYPTPTGACGPHTWYLGCRLLLFVLRIKPMVMFQSKPRYSKWQLSIEYKKFIDQIFIKKLKSNDLKIFIKKCGLINWQITVDLVIYEISSTTNMKWRFESYVWQ